MRKLVFLWPLLAAASVGAQSPAGSTLILSDKYGRPMTIGSQDDARAALASSHLTGVAVAEAFYALCLADGFDPAVFEKAAPASPLQLQPQTVVLEPVGKAKAYTQARFAGPTAVASWWGGDEDGLKNRAIGIRYRGAVVASAYGPFKALGRQCNVSVKLAKVGDLQVMADRLATLTGGTPIKIVVKPKWADGSWSLAGGKRVSFAVVDAETGAALAHFTVQDIEGAAK